jgi:DNA-directed RNA polymerase subunit RPC12/RpoP
MYDYLCTKCEIKIENAIVDYAERDMMHCEFCGSKLERLIPVPAKAQWNCSCPTASGGK